MRILVVDDEPAFRFLLNSTLTKWGHEVSTVANGGEAWHMLSNGGAFDMILSDWNMPELDGLALCRLIRQSSHPSYQYVILCTGNNQKSHYVAGMEAGADDFVVKPIDFADLRLRLRAAERVLDLQAKLAAQNSNLTRLNNELGHAYRIIERDLKAASALQLSLLPERFEIHRRVKLDWLAIPSGFLTGDMLNYFMADERHLVFYLLDVSGHSIPAALLSVTLNRILLPESGSPVIRLNSHNGKREIVTPSEVVGELNRRFQGQEDQYFTMVYGVFDTESGEVRICQAGHPSPIFVSAKGEQQTIGTGGFPVGMWPDMKYDESSVYLTQGDRLLLYSDGVTECKNPAGEAYDEQKLKAFLAQGSNVSHRALLEGIRRDISSWHGKDEFADDVSMLVLEST